MGVLLFAGFVLQTIGLRSTSPGVSGFLTSLYVIMVPIILGLFTGRWPSPMVGLGVVVVVGGLALLSLYGKLGFGWGEILTLIATIFWALHILGVDYASTRISAIALVQLQMTVCAVLSLAGAFIFERPALFPGWEATGIVLWTGFMGGLVAYLLMALGQRYTPPTLAGVLMNLEAVFALVVSIICRLRQPDSAHGGRFRPHLRRHHRGSPGLQRRHPSWRRSRLPPGPEAPNAQGSAPAAHKSLCDSSARPLGRSARHFLSRFTCSWRFILRASAAFARRSSRLRGLALVFIPPYAWRLILAPHSLGAHHLVRSMNVATSSATAG